MGFEQIGLQAVFDTVAFKNGLREYTQGIDKATGGTTNAAVKIGAVMAKAAAIAIAAIIAIATAITATLVSALKKAIEVTIDWGNDLYRTRQLLGTTAEQTAGFALIADTAGMSIDDVVRAIDLMAKGLESAKGIIGTSGQALKNMGIDVYDANGKVRDTTTLFGEVATKLNAMPPGLERTAIMMQLFGRSGADMDEVLRLAASGGMTQFIQKAQQMGLVMSDEQIDRIKRLTESWNMLKDQFKGIQITLMEGLIPVLQKLVTWISNVVQSLMPAITHFGTFLSMLTGAKAPGAVAVSSAGSVPGIDFSKLSQDQINWCWMQYWNGNGPRPPEGTKYTGGKGTPPATTTGTPRMVPLSETFNEPFVLTPFEQAIQGFIDTLKNTDWKSIGDNLLDFGTRLLHIDWEKTGKSLISLAQSINDFAAMLQPWGEKNPFIKAMDAWAEFVNWIIEGINKILEIFGAPGIAPLIKSKPTFKLEPGLPNISTQATGGDYIVRKPTLFLAGEAGPERALFIPMGAGNVGAYSNQVTIPIYATINNGLDVEALAYRVAQVYQRRPR